MRTPSRGSSLPERDRPASTDQYDHERFGGSMFNLQVDAEPFPVVLDRIEEWARTEQPRLVVTPNTDHFLRWQRSDVFRRLYEQADLVVLDGAPLVLLARVQGLRAARVTGADLFMATAEAAARDGVPFIIVGGGDGVAELAAQRLREQFSGLLTPVVLSPSLAEVTSPKWLQLTGRALAAYPRKYVALCLGSPKQEQLYADLLRHSPDMTGVYLCVGAAVDFAAGTVPRAPRVVQRLGIEWLFRLVIEPRRLWRRYLVDDVQIAGYLLRATLRRIRGERALDRAVPPRSIARTDVLVTTGPVPLQRSNARSVTNRSDVA